MEASFEAIHQVDEDYSAKENLEGFVECLIKSEETIEKSFDPLMTNSSNELSLCSVSNLLETSCSGLSLCLIQVEDYLVVQRKHFDLKVFGEPFRAIQLLVKLETWTYLVKTFGSKSGSGQVSSLKELHTLCYKIFDKTVPCAGVCDFISGSSCHFVGSSFPHLRMVSENCSKLYTLPKNGRELSESEKLGIGLCHNCDQSELSKQPVIKEEIFISESKIVLQNIETSDMCVPEDEFME